MRGSTLRRRTIAAAVLLIPCLGGCGASGTAPEPPDPAAARAALDTALEAWKQGESADALKEKGRSIEVSDDQWSKGVRLLRYEVAPNDRTWGADQHFRVVLWLDNGRGRERREAAEYNVSTTPITAVVRVGL